MLMIMYTHSLMSLLSVNQIMYKTVLFMQEYLQGTAAVETHRVGLIFTQGGSITPVTSDPSTSLLPMLNLSDHCSHEAGLGHLTILVTIRWHNRLDMSTLKCVSWN